MMKPSPDPAMPAPGNQTPVSNSVDPGAILAGMRSQQPLPAEHEIDRLVKSACALAEAATGSDQLAHALSETTAAIDQFDRWMPLLQVRGAELDEKFTRFQAQRYRTAFEENELNRQRGQCARLRGMVDGGRKDLVRVRDELTQKAAESEARRKALDDLPAEVKAAGLAMTPEAIISIMNIGEPAEVFEIDRRLGWVDALTHHWGEPIAGEIERRRAAMRSGSASAILAVQETYRVASTAIEMLADMRRDLEQRKDEAKQADALCVLRELGERAVRATIAAMEGHENYVALATTIAAGLELIMRAEVIRADYSRRKEAARRNGIDVSGLPPLPPMIEGVKGQSFPALVRLPGPNGGPFTRSADDPPIWWMETGKDHASQLVIAELHAEIAALRQELARQAPRR